jgi:hypothetical protein
MVRRPIDPSVIFSGLQAEMEAKLRGPQGTNDVDELDWLDWFATFLPKRYGVEGGVVVGSNGRLSEKLDVIVFHRQRGHCVLEEDGTSQVPAACVRAVIEVRQTLSLSAMRRASSKMLSVRRMQPNRAEPILGCVVTLDGKLGPRHLEFLRGLPKGECIDIACSLSGSFFKLGLLDGGTARSNTHENTQAQSTNPLLTFLLSLLLELQNIGDARGHNAETGAKRR